MTAKIGKIDTKEAARFESFWWFYIVTHIPGVVVMALLFLCAFIENLILMRNKQIGIIPAPV